MATTSPFAFSALTSRSFCSGTTRQKMLTCAQPLLQLPRRRARPAPAGDHAAGARQADLAGDVERRLRMIAGDHDHADSRLPGFAYGARNGGTHRIQQAHQAQEFESKSCWIAGSCGSRKSALATPSTRSPSAAKRSTCAEHRVGRVRIQDGTDPRSLRARPWPRPRTAARSGDRQT